MTNTSIQYKLAFQFLKGANSELVRKLQDNGISAEDFYSKSTPELCRLLNIRSAEYVEQYRRDEAVFKAKEELERIRRHNIRVLYILDDDYPLRLAEIPDPPLILFKIGDGSLDSLHMMSIVGTRRPTPYGTTFCEKLITDLSAYFPDLAVVSGLAYGIDAVAHKSSLQTERETIAVVAHGLDMIYPANHRELAKRIIKSGGAIISEYPFGEKPYRSHFLERNRIIAGLSDVTVVVESAIKGGAMSTANFAFNYSRDVMALPGRLTDELSAGCNLLIRKEKAHLVMSAPDLIETTGWQPLDKRLEQKNRNLFPELDGDTKTIYDLLRFAQEPMQLDRLHQLSSIPVANLMAILSEMEFDGIIVKYPGNRYAIS